jgi:hypothetical protein
MICTRYRLGYSETSLNRTLKKPVFPEYRLIFYVPAEQFFAKEVLQTGHPSKAAIFFGPRAGRFREVSLYIKTGIVMYIIVNTVC